MRERHLLVLVAAAIVGGLFAASDASAQAPSLGVAEDFTVLGASTVTNTGLTVVEGNLGLTPGSSVTGFPPGTVVNGSININNVSATSAKTAAQAAFTGLIDLPCGVTFGAGQDLTVLSPMMPGVYCFTSTALLTGPLVLDSGGDPDADFIFKIASTFTASNNSSVVVNGGSGCNVYFAVGSSATIGTGSTFVGNILASSGIILNTGASALGRLFSLNGAVTLDTNIVTRCPLCAPITLSPSTLPNGAFGEAYGPVTITASGGTAPHTFAVTAGTLPNGVTLSPGGVISGTPTQAGSFSVTISATDAGGCQGNRIYPVDVDPPVITFGPATLPGGTAGMPYSQTITASGGTAPYTFALVSGSLPPGLILSADGTLSGIPTQGSFVFTVQATDAAGFEAMQAYTLAIGAAAIPALDWLGMVLMVMLLVVVALFAMKRLV